jgi:putative transposase
MNRRKTFIFCHYNPYAITSLKSLRRSTPFIAPKTKTMANTYSQIYLQFVFAVKHRESLIPREHKEELHKYMTGLVQNRQSKMLQVHCMPDHTHLFVGYKPNMLIPDFIKEIKVEANEFINDKGWVNGRFSWQEGYGVFSYAHSQIATVCNYVANQEIHHQKKTFRQEYVELLHKFEVPFEERYLFEFME